jgi:hypothetical protein
MSKSLNGDSCKALSAAIVPLIQEDNVHLDGTRISALEKNVIRPESKNERVRQNN